MGRLARRRAGSAYVQILHQPAHRGHGDLDFVGDRRGGHDRRVARSPVPRHRPAGGADPGELCRCRRPDRRAVRGYAYRAANERRGQPELHVFVERGQRSNDHDRGLRCENGPEHRSDSHANARDPSRFAASGRGYELWRHSTEIRDSAPDAHQPLLTKRNL